MIATITMIAMTSARYWYAVLEYQKIHLSSTSRTTTVLYSRVD